MSICFLLLSAGRAFEGTMSCDLLQMSTTISNCLTTAKHQSIQGVVHPQFWSSHAGAEHQWYFLAEISVRSSPRKKINFRYLKRHFLDRSIQKVFYLILKTEALQSIIRSYREACRVAVDELHKQSISLEGHSDAEKHDMLRKCAMTSMNSKLVSGEKEFFSTMVVDAVS